MTEITTIEKIWPSHISHVIGSMIKPIMMAAIPIMMIAVMVIVMVAIPKRELKMFTSHIWFEPIEYILAIVVDHIHSSVICVSGHVGTIIELVIPFLALSLSFFPKFLTLLQAELLRDTEIW